MTSNHRKRRRHGTGATATVFYRDPIPMFSDYDTVRSSEGSTIYVGGTSRGARVQHTTEIIAGVWEGFRSWSPPDDTNYALNSDGQIFDQALEADINVAESDSESEGDNPGMPPASAPNAQEDARPVEARPSKKERSKVSKRPNVVWKETSRQSYLDEIMRWEGRGDSRHFDKCMDCVARSKDLPAAPEYRCRDCFYPDLTCRACCVKRHRLNPWHRIQKWTGHFFTDISLKGLGMSLQLNHLSGVCENPIPCHSNMVVLHTNGIHYMNVLYCGCARSIPFHIQLLRRRLYPATQISVQTVATFDLLRHLHKMALTTKASTYDFYRCLENLTSSLKIQIPSSRYRSLFRMILQWRHLHMLKWAGRGNATSGAAGTSEGELAIMCPSCPHPDINLPIDWAQAPDATKFLYAMIICMDANFRLKNQLVSNYSQDPGLGIGWAYMVPRMKYEEYVLKKANDSDISTCVGFQALAKANNKFSVGLRYTGVGATVCGRSEMILRVGNLHKGERYSNMDYIFGSILKRVAIHLVLASYDICCQWFINLFQRMERDWPPEIKPPPNVKLSGAIPKLHASMHKEKNHDVYSFNLIPGVGLTDGECPERVWAPHNPLANATKTQGPGSRQDTLDDHFGFWNWSKYISMGTILLRRYKKAIAERNIQTEGHRGLSNSVGKKLVDRWEKMCVEWETDAFPKSKPNPYYMPDNTLSEAQVKKDLADTEAAFLAEGGTFPHKTTASAFIALGLELEEAQRRVRKLAKGTSDHATIRQAGSLSEQRNALLARIKAWEQLLPIYMPAIIQYQIDNKIASSEYSENIILWLPSTVPEVHRARVCPSQLAEIEQKLRRAQLADSLYAVRQILKVKSRMLYFKNKNIRGQRGGTRSTSVIDRIHERARFAAAKYRAARIAYHALSGTGEWEKTFRILEDKDIRGYQDPNRLRPRTGRRGIFDDDHVILPEVPSAEGDFDLSNQVRTKRNGTGETRRTLSWIWTVRLGDATAATNEIDDGTATTAENDDETGDEEEDQDEGLRVEWAKSRARAHRAEEEVMLLKEEMRRILVFLEWKANWWRDRHSVGRPDLSKVTLEGISAFAASQADIQETLAAHFRKLWQSSLQDSGHGQSAGSRVQDGDDASGLDGESDDEEVEDVEYGYD